MNSATRTLFPGGLQRLLLLAVTVTVALTAVAGMAKAVDDNINAASGQQETVAEGFYSLPEFVTYEGQDYALRGGALTRDQMQLLYPGVTWVYYREDGTTQWNITPLTATFSAGTRIRPSWSPGRGRSSRIASAGPTTDPSAAGSGIRSAATSSPFPSGRTSR